MPIALLTNVFSSAMYRCCSWQHTCCMREDKDVCFDEVHRREQFMIERDGTRDRHSALCFNTNTHTRCSPCHDFVHGRALCSSGAGRTRDMLRHRLQLHVPPLLSHATGMRWMQRVGHGPTHLSVCIFGCVCVRATTYSYAFSRARIFLLQSVSPFRCR
jgi:hypothetical protein